MKNLYFAQVFWKHGFNTTAYYTRKQLRDSEIEHYTILDTIRPNEIKEKLSHKITEEEAVWLFNQVN